MFSPYHITYHVCIPTLSPINNTPTTCSALITSSIMSVPPHYHLFSPYHITYHFCIPTLSPINNKPSTPILNDSDFSFLVRICVKVTKYRIVDGSIAVFCKFFLATLFFSDIDECSQNSQVCGDRECINTRGSYQCEIKCQKGFRRNRNAVCIGIESLI